MGGEPAGTITLDPVASDAGDSGADVGAFIFNVFWHINADVAGEVLVAGKVGVVGHCRISSWGP